MPSPHLRFYSSALVKDFGTLLHDSKKATPVLYRGESSTMATVNPARTTDEETLTLINHVLDFIRGNLSNIEKVWGRGSSQYKAASQVMQQYLDENLKKLNVERSGLDHLMQGLSLDDKKSQSSS
jgi:hypothetical protein